MLQEPAAAFAVTHPGTCTCSQSGRGATLPPLRPAWGCCAIVQCPPCQRLCVRCRGGCSTPVPLVLGPSCSAAPLRLLRAVLGAGPVAVTRGRYPQLAGRRPALGAAQGQHMGLCAGSVWVCVGLVWVCAGLCGSGVGLCGVCVGLCGSLSGVGLVWVWCGSVRGLCGSVWVCAGFVRVCAGLCGSVRECAGHFGSLRVSVGLPGCVLSLTGGRGWASAHLHATRCGVCPRTVGTPVSEACAGKLCFVPPPAIPVAVQTAMRLDLVVSTVAGGAGPGQPRWARPPPTPCRSWRVKCRRGPP